MYDEVMNMIPDFVQVLLSWLDVILTTLLQYFGIIATPVEEPTTETE